VSGKAELDKHLQNSGLTNLIANVSTIRHFSQGCVLRLPANFAFGHHHVLRNDDGNFEVVWWMRTNANGLYMGHRLQISLLVIIMCFQMMMETLLPNDDGNFEVVWWMRTAFII
jgi:hypothetical protein